ncbi:FAD-binding domain-containing protein [Paraphaeosphaeria sporulosa]|uniref:FAD-binding domain-containing protein n=1 Tax=Paraphaeosphaeria sporulosa TaxID=1460663 RepID=A0A177CWQ0_9PLEO|nr:FAD-binding domain-containing protein [Paraphaeosphaeria sporulosa]OAG11159.1 FAD-binding domain-containing protein [Paraphaeosphaeria sporulosa]
MRVVSFLAIGLFSGALAATVSNDATCGGTNKYTCLGSTFGNCCSSAGWCGSTSAYCGTGCQSAYGNCGSNSPTSSKPVSSKSIASSTKSSSAPASTSTKKVSTDATCGGSKGYTCLGSSFGNCCSANGWCGSTSAYCGTGCQSGFGNCGSNNGASSTVLSSTKVTSATSKTSAVSSPSATASGSATQCLTGKKVPYKVSSDAAYSQLAQPYNLRLPYKPAVIVLPTTNQHVQDAVVCGAKGGLKIQAKSGGHSYASFSSGGKDGSMVIDLESFQNVALDTSSGVVQVGGGVRLGNLADGIYQQGKRALSHGTCPGVGIGGHSTHGGYGTTSRSWGLAMDAITAADVVLANGTLIKASSTQNSEIYWGIRGAAESLGIIVNFYMQTRAAPESVTYFAIPWTGMFDQKSTFTNGWLRLQEIARNSSVIDNRISFGVYLDNAGTFSLSGFFSGTVAEFNSKIKPEFLRNMPTAGTPTVKSYGWYDYLVLLGGKDTIKEPTTGYAEHDTFFAKSLTVPETDGLSAAALNAYYDYIKSGSVTFYSIINLYGGPGSAINSKDTTFAAYSDRDSLWVFQNYGTGAGADVVSYMNGMNDAIIKAQPNTKFGAYLNYVDPSYDAATAHKLYYGDAVYARLAALKKVVDPANVFWNPQSIGA